MLKIEAAPAHTHPKGGSMIDILMIEDDIEISALLTKFLEQYGMRVQSVETPKAALNALELDRYDLIILDLTLPQMDGLELCKTIRKDYDTPIIISSARSDLTDKIIGLEYGADDYLPKPYKPPESRAYCADTALLFSRSGAISSSTKARCRYAIRGGSSI